ncbi:unnamed protein product [Allacma fusca]|uniref:Uncharacterized protein n=1 Tax=Allacma fusca TaxID=39272 RepID=A0A8J2PHK0_9HEXA|nr:unnamed protein product [Allacma fusca]
MCLKSSELSSKPLDGPNMENTTKEAAAQPVGNTMLLGNVSFGAKRSVPALINTTDMNMLNKPYDHANDSVSLKVLLNI